MGSISTNGRQVGIALTAGKRNINDCTRLNVFLLTSLMSACVIVSYDDNGLALMPKSRQPIEYLDDVIKLITDVVDDKSTHSHRVFPSVINNVTSLIPEGGQAPEDLHQGPIMPDNTKAGIIEFLAIVILMHRVNVHYLGTRYNFRTDHLLHKTVAMFLCYLVGDLERVSLYGSCPMEHTYRLILNKVNAEDTPVKIIKETDDGRERRGRDEVTYSDYISRYWNDHHKRLSSKYGIVFSPDEVVDFINRSVVDILNTEFDGLKRGVTIMDPFLGAGIFVTRLLETGVIPPEDLEYKYLNDIFGQEIVLYSYYTAIMNISTTYENVTGKYLTFQNISLMDTFQTYECERNTPTVLF